MNSSGQPDGIRKTVLITGATGFLGSHVCQEFVRRGYKILAYRRSQSDCSRLSGIKDQVWWFDVADGYETPFAESRQIDSVVHLATNYGRGEDEVVAQVETNLIFPLTLLELCRRFGVAQFVNTGSFIVKGSCDYTYLQRYALTKIQLSQWAKTYAGELHVIDAILEHVYGENDNPDKFIPWLIRSLLSDVRHVDFTSGVQQRDFVYAGDVADAYATIVGASKSDDPGYTEVSIGSGQLTSIREMVLAMENVIQSGKELRFGQLPQRDNEILSSKCDNSMIELFGWSARTELSDGLEKTVDSFREQLDVSNSAVVRGRDT